MEVTGLNGALSSATNGQIAVIAVIGGIASYLQGGKFGHGFISAGISARMGASDGIKRSMEAAEPIKKLITQVTIGGTVSRIGGGKFANGAGSAAFSMMLSRAYGAQAARKPRSQEVIYARLANGVYDPEFQGANGYVKSDNTFIDDETELQSALFVHETTGHSVMAFAGTNGRSDWLANIRQAFGKESVQYSQALDQAETAYENTGGDVHFVGHSLGRSLAAASAIMTGGGATTFNAAGVHSNTVGELTSVPGSITQFNSAFDVMQMGNALTPASARGFQVSLGAAGVHGMGGVCRVMGC